MGKCSKAESAERQQEIHEMRLDGHSRYRIVQYGMDKWNISERMIDKYIKKINDKLCAKAEENMTQKTNRAIQRCERLMIKCFNKKRELYDVKTAAMIAKEIHDIEGLKTHKIEGTDVPININYTIKK